MAFSSKRVHCATELAVSESSRVGIVRQLAFYLPMLRLLAITWPIMRFDRGYPSLPGGDRVPKGPSSSCSGGL